MHINAIYTYLFYFLLIALFVDGALPQLQYLLFGEVILYSVFIKILLLATVLASFFGQLRKETPNHILSWIHNHAIVTMLWAALLIYFGFDWFHLRSKIPTIYYIFSLNAYYYYLLLLPFAIFIRMDVRSVSKYLFIIAVPLSIFGILQYILNEPLAYMGDNESYFEVANWNYFGRLRAFSLFNYSGGFGYFLAILVCFYFHYLIFEKGIRRLPMLLLIVATIFTIYITFTRAAYIAAGMSLLTATLLVIRDKIKYGNHLIKVLPVVYLCISFIIVNEGSFVNVPHSSLLSNVSLLMRYNQWLHVSELWLDKGIANILFGVGLIQNGRFELTKGLIIDNAYLAIGLHVGLIGLILWFLIMWSLWSCLLSLQQRAQDNPVLFCAVAFWSTWMATGVFAITTTIYPIIAMIALPTLRPDLLFPEASTVENRS